MSFGTMVNGEYKQLSGGVSPSVINRIATLEGELNALKQEVGLKQDIIQKESGNISFDTNYSVRLNKYIKIGNVASIALFVNNNDNVIPKGRIKLGTLPVGLRPLLAGIFVIGACDKVSSYVNRTANVIIYESGVIDVDNYTYDDIKEFVLYATYIVQD